MNELKIFEHPKFGKIRTIVEDGKSLFCGLDAANALQYKNPSKALADHCKNTVERRANDSLGRQQNMKFISEGDLCRLAAKSEMPGADEFESWIFDEVVPSVLKHGAYMTPATIEKVLSDPDTIIRLATSLKEEREKRAALETQAEVDKPKVLFADAVSVSNNSILVGELAKLLKQNGVNIGQNRLFKWLRANGYLIRRKGTDYNMPTQRAMELGLFEIKETAITHADGHTSVNKTPKVTGRGQMYFVEKFLGQVRRDGRDGGSGYALR